VIDCIIQIPSSNYLSHGYYKGHLLEARRILKQRGSGFYDVFKNEPRIPNHSEGGRHPFNILIEETINDN